MGVAVIVAFVAVITAIVGVIVAFLSRVGLEIAFNCIRRTQRFAFPALRAPNQLPEWG
jgi:uncharacterized membrane protein